MLALGVVAIFVLGLVVASHLGRVLILGYLQKERGWGRFIIVAIPWLVFASAAAVGPLFLTQSRLIDFEAEKPIFNAFIWAYADTLAVAISYLFLWAVSYLGALAYLQLKSSKEAQIRSEQEAKEALLISLKAQINPHFLFNSLNALRGLLPGELSSPREFITLLSELLLADLTRNNRGLITLEEEMKTVACYLSIEKIRFPDRLVVCYDLPDDIGKVKVPSFIVQTVVENAIKHGIARSTSKGEVAIGATRQGDMIVVSVRNPGIIIASPESTGIGLKNARARLKHHLGPAAGIDLVQLSDSVVEARIFIPFVDNENPNCR
jgi:LytS/YehU family sensor histidine kinase